MASQIQFPDSSNHNKANFSSPFLVTLRFPPYCHWYHILFYKQKLFWVENCLDEKKIGLLKSGWRRQWSIDVLTVLLESQKLLISKILNKKCRRFSIASHVICSLPSSKFSLFLLLNISQMICKTRVMIEIKWVKNGDFHTHLASNSSFVSTISLAILWTDSFVVLLPSWRTALKIWLERMVTVFQKTVEWEKWRSLYDRKFGSLCWNDSVIFLGLCVFFFSICRSQFEQPNKLVHETNTNLFRWLM